MLVASCFSKYLVDLEARDCNGDNGALIFLRVAVIIQ